MLKRYMCYCFEATLKSVDEDSYYTKTFQVVSEDLGRARGKLWEYLNHPEQTFYRYEKCVKLTLQPVDFILIDEEEP